MMVASTAATRNDHSWPNNGSVAKIALGGPRVSLVGVVALPHTLAPETAIDCAARSIAAFSATFSGSGKRSTISRRAPAAPSAQNPG
jgi:hypothetical protein